MVKKRHRGEWDETEKEKILRRADGALLRYLAAGLRGVKGTLEQLSGPLEVELGCGKGTFICTSAAAAGSELYRD